MSRPALGRKRRRAAAADAQRPGRAVAGASYSAWLANLQTAPGRPLSLAHVNPRETAVTRLKETMTRGVRAVRPTDSVVQAAQSAADISEPTEPDRSHQSQALGRMAGGASKAQFQSGYSPRGSSPADEDPRFQGV